MPKMIDGIEGPGPNWADPIVGSTSGDSSVSSQKPLWGQVVTGVLELNVAAVGLGWYALNYITRSVGLVLGIFSMVLVLSATFYVKDLQREVVHAIRDKWERDGVHVDKSTVITPADVGEAAGGPIVRRIFALIQVALPFQLGMVYTAYVNTVAPWPKAMVAPDGWLEGSSDLAWATARYIAVSALVLSITLPAVFWKAWVHVLGLIGFAVIWLFFVVLMFCLEGDAGFEYWPRSEFTASEVLDNFFAVTAQFFALSAFMGYYLTFQQRVDEKVSDRSLNIVLCLLLIIYGMTLVMGNKALGRAENEVIFADFDKSTHGRLAKMLAGGNLLVSIALMKLAYFQEVPNFVKAWCGNTNEKPIFYMKYLGIAFSFAMATFIPMKHLNRVTWVLGVFILPCQQGLIHGVAKVRLDIEKKRLRFPHMTRGELFRSYMGTYWLKFTLLIWFGCYLIFCTVCGMKTTIQTLLDG